MWDLLPKILASNLTKEKLKMNMDVDPSKELNDEVPNDSLTLGQLRKIVKQFPNKQKVKKNFFLLVDLFDLYCSH